MTDKASSKPSKLLEKLANNEVIIAAEGYLMELERRGYNRHGSFVPTVVLDHPEKVEELTREFVHAGSDISQAFTYYAHREKLKAMNREDEFETLNRRAHEIAKKVAEETGTIFCVGIGTTNIYDPDSPEAIKTCEMLLREQISVSAEFGVDYIALETLWDYGEASIGLKIAKEFGLPAVVTLAPVDLSGELKTFDDYRIVDALKLLQKEGAACVGVNCARGPDTMIPIVRQLRKEIEGPLACLALAYHTTEEHPTWYKLKHHRTGARSFPNDMGAHFLGISDAEWFGQQLKEIGVEYVGFCCGNTGSYTRAVAMQFGRTPPGAKYTSDFDELNSLVGEKETTNARNRAPLAKFFYG
ncbi:betaine--homocysteine S-methyltransferase 1-like [Watersipora subatra]|uniref:betaine--homocysteine S-methyltransferase 1-like n=1 Tax=Watersipora subatra TaxID=2589382 RepID=UPI00355C1455